MRPKGKPERGMVVNQQNRHEDRHIGTGFYMAYKCEVCGERKALPIHWKCSKIIQQRYRDEDKR